MSVASRRITNIFLLAGGIALLTVAVVTGLRQWALVSAGTVVEGHVGTMQPPYFNLVFRDGKQTIAVSRSAPLWGTALHKGDTVPILYLKEKPAESARVNYAREIWLLPGSAALAGLLMFYSLFGRVRERRDARYALAESDVTSFNPLALMRWALLFLAVAVIGFSGSRPAPSLEEDLEGEVTTVATQDAAGIPYLTGENFKNVMATSAVPVFALAWSQSCKNCAPYDTEMKRIATAWTGRVTPYKINDEVLAKQLGVRSYPAVFVLFRGGILARDDSAFLKETRTPHGQPVLSVDEPALWNFIGQAELRARAMK